MASDPTQGQDHLLPYFLEAPYREIQMRIGELMRRHYELPRELPERISSLLAQLIGQEND